MMRPSCLNCERIERGYDLKLLGMLSQDSKIIAFQHRFKLQDVDYSDTDYIEWVFKTRDVPIADLPEDTGLQRNMKRHLLNGGTIGTGYGILTSAVLINRKITEGGKNE